MMKLFCIFVAALCVVFSAATATELTPTSVSIVTGSISTFTVANIASKNNGLATWSEGAVGEIVFQSTNSTADLNAFIITYNGSIVPSVTSLINGAWVALPLKLNVHGLTYGGISWQRAVFNCYNRFNSASKSITIRVQFNIQTKVDYVHVGVNYIGHTTFSQPDIAWNQDISDASLASNSAEIISWLTTNGGFGSNGGMLQIDFSITVLETLPQTPFKNFIKTSDFFTPDCDYAPFPVPQVGHIEGETGYSCTHNGDCHFLVYHPPSKKVYEMWRASIGASFFGGCTAIWKTNSTYPRNLRGDSCTSADAGGFPITAMLFDANEVCSGSINHAIRFILPNSKIAQHIYVYPSTHSTNPTSGPTSTSPPYGARLRLKSSFDLNSITNIHARSIAAALKKYGMILSDGGSVSLTAASDSYTAIKWNEVGINSDSLGMIGTDDFEVVSFSGGIHDLGDCSRTVIH